MVPDWHKIQFPQYLLIHPMAAVLSVDTAVSRTMVAVVDDHLEFTVVKQLTYLP